MSEYFLRRYKQIEPDAELIDIENVGQAIRVFDDSVLDILKKKNVELEKIPWLKNGWWVSADFSLGSTKEYLLGMYYLQAPLSQLTCEILNPDSEVLDMAAAPGSKTTYLAHMIPKSYVLALDISVSRLASVRNNAERMNIPNIICMKKDARFAFDLNKKFKYVLLDAPCSGNYCSGPGWAEKRKIQDIDKNARLQKELLKSAYKCLAPGGKLLYSTCSLEPEENEVVISWFLEKYEDIGMVDIDVPIGDSGTTEWNGENLHPDVIKTKRFWPHKTGCEGFFIALVQKNG